MPGVVACRRQQPAAGPAPGLRAGQRRPRRRPAHRGARRRHRGRRRRRAHGARRAARGRAPGRRARLDQGQHRARQGRRRRGRPDQDRARAGHRHHPAHDRRRPAAPAAARRRRRGCGCPTCPRTGQKAAGIAGVSAMGTGGLNVHLVLRSEPRPRSRHDRVLPVRLARRDRARAGTGPRCAAAPTTARPAAAYLLHAPDRTAAGRDPGPDRATWRPGCPTPSCSDLACQLGPRRRASQGPARVAIVASKQEQLARLAARPSTCCRPARRPARHPARHLRGRQRRRPGHAAAVRRPAPGHAGRTRTAARLRPGPVAGRAALAGPARRQRRTPRSARPRRDRRPDLGRVPVRGRRGIGHGHPKQDP